MPIVNEELSERELEILGLLATGVSNKEIASQLSISTNTVKVHVRNIFAKTGASTRTEAVLYAMKSGLIPPATVTPELEDLLADKPEVGGPGEAVEALPASLPTAALSDDRRVMRMVPFWVVWLAIFAVVAAALAGFWAWRTAESTQATLAPVSSQDEARWKTLAPMTVARYGLAGEAFEGFIYAIAGQTGSGPTGAVERYNPIDNSWKRLAEKPTPVYEVSAAVSGGEIYVPGGRLSANQATNVLEIYNPRLNNWRQGSPLPVSLSGYAMASYEGRLYLFGRWDGTQFVDTVYRYTPADDHWTLVAHLPAVRGYSAAVTIGRRIYILGGFDGQKGLSDNLTYQPDLEGGDVLWEEVTELPARRYGMGGVSIGELAVLIGGIQEKESLSSLMYLPYTGEWRTFRGLESQSPVYPGTTALGNFVYVMGGQVAGQPSAQHLAYQAIYTVSFPVIR